MSSLSKVYNAKIRRRRSSQLDSPPPLSDRTGLSVRAVPPRLRHLTGDALAEPFPPIAVGGYIKYYRKYAGTGELRITLPSTFPSRDAHNDPLGNKAVRDIKARRRASSASVLVGPFLSQLPHPSPSKKIPPKSQLFGTTHIQISSPISSSRPSRIPVPQSPKQKHLSIIPEASRETMRADIDVDAMFTSQSRKPRVVSLPPFSVSTQSPSLTSSGPDNSFTPDPSDSPITSNSVNSANSVKLSRTSALRRSHRRLLRTPSVERDFTPYAKGMMNIPKSDSNLPRSLSRQYSSGSEGTDEEGAMSGTESVNTAITSLLEPSLSSASSSSSPPSSPSSLASPVSPTKCKTEEFSGTDKIVFPAITDAEPSPAFDRPKSPRIFDLFHSNGSGSLDDWDLQKFIELASKTDDIGKRGSWSSFATAVSSPELDSIGNETDEIPSQDILHDQQAIGIAL